MNYLNVDNRYLVNKVINKKLILSRLNSKETIKKIIINEIEEMRQIYQFKPSCITSYFRQAWHGSEFDPWLRITFDVNMRGRTKDLDLSSKKIWKYMVSPDMSIMEVKCNDSVPLWITEMVSKHNLRLIRVSKYCQWLETAELVSNSSYLVR